MCVASVMGESNCFSTKSNFIFVYKLTSEHLLRQIYTKNVEISSHYLNQSISVT